jgi:hypothetical protein
MLNTVLHLFRRADHSNTSNMHLATNRIALSKRLLAQGIYLSVATLLLGFKAQAATRTGIDDSCVSGSQTGDSRIAARGIKAMRVTADRSSNLSKCGRIAARAQSAGGRTNGD